jgi:hypothetical protein
LTLLNASILAMRQSLKMLNLGKEANNILDFEGLKSRIGFREYYDKFDRYNV